jgi:hypothetical protein
VHFFIISPISFRAENNPDHRDLSYGARQFLPLYHHDQAWIWLGRYYFHRDIFTNAVSGQQVQFPQVFQLEDPGVEDPVYIQGQSGMVNIVQFQHGDILQRLTWDPGIVGLSISLSNRGNWTFVGDSCFAFPLSFNVEESISLEGVSRRSYNTSFWHQ